MVFKYFLLSIMLFGFVCMAKADTIDYWHVKYNNKLIRQYTGNDVDRSVTINFIKVKVTDKITVIYGNNTPCNACVTELILTDIKNRKYVISRAKGIFSPLTFRVRNIKSKYTIEYKVYFRELGKPEVLLFVIKAIGT